MYTPNTVKNSRRKQNRGNKKECSVKNCEHWILDYFQAMELACHSFTDASRKKMTPGSKVKDFDTHGTESRMSIRIFASVPFPKNFT